MIKLVELGQTDLWFNVKAVTPSTTSELPPMLTVLKQIAPTPTQKPVTPAVTPAITPVTPTPITAQISPTTIGIGIAIAIGLIAIFGHHKEVK